MGSDVQQSALLPLTVFDLVFEQTAFVTGWLVEGTIDEKALSNALDRLTQKWRMLAGRLHSIKSPTVSIFSGGVLLVITYSISRRRSGSLTYH
jgi:hypothetical protein